MTSGFPAVHFQKFTASLSKQCKTRRVRVILLNGRQFKTKAKTKVTKRKLPLVLETTLVPIGPTISPNGAKVKSAVLMALCHRNREWIDHCLPQHPGAFARATQQLVFSFIYVALGPMNNGTIALTEPNELSLLIGALLFRVHFTQFFSFYSLFLFCFLHSTHCTLLVVVFVSPCGQVIRRRCAT